MPFEGVARQALLALKYRRRRTLARQLARLMVRRLRLGSDPAAGAGPGRRRPPFDVVTWAPTTRARVAQRGFDQAELLARAVARELGVPCRRLLYRAHGPAQTGRGRVDRLAAPGFRPRPVVRSCRVLLVDDVVTTGATLAAAADALRGAGASEVRVVAVAATPAQPRRAATPVSVRTVATAAAGSGSTSTPTSPAASAAVTLVSTSSRKAVRPGVAPSLATAS